MGDNLTRIFSELDIPLRGIDGTYRPMIDILEELSECWDKLSSCQADFIHDIVEGVIIKND